MSTQRNHYEVLGLPPEATTDQVKKKYRDLARKFHPDVVQDKVLGQRVFSQINQAYAVLGDPEKRAQYNSALATQKANENGASAHRAASPGQAPAAQARPMAPQGQPGTAQKSQAVSGLLTNADNAIMAGKPIEALAFCNKALEVDPRNVHALDVLGDALVQMGRREDAALQYRKALQIAPSRLIQAKLSRLEQVPPARPPEQPKPPPGNSDKPGGGLFGRFLGKK